VQRATEYDRKDFLQNREEILDEKGLGRPTPADMLACGDNPMIICASETANKLHLGWAIAPLPASLRSLNLWTFHRKSVSSTATIPMVC
jgi:hypothetical protein